MGGWGRSQQRNSGEADGGRTRGGCFSATNAFTKGEGAGGRARSLGSRQSGLGPGSATSQLCDPGKDHLTSLGVHSISSTEMVFVEMVLKPSLRLRWKRLECLPQMPTKVSPASPWEQPVREWGELPGQAWPFLPARELTGEGSEHRADGDGMWGQVWPMPAL